MKNTELELERGSLLFLVDSSKMFPSRYKCLLTPIITDLNLGK